MNFPNPLALSHLLSKKVIQSGLPTMVILSPKSTFWGIFTPVGGMSGIWGFFGDFWVYHENIWVFFVKCEIWCFFGDFQP